MKHGQSEIDTRAPMKAAGVDFLRDGEKQNSRKMAKNSKVHPADGLYVGCSSSSPL